MSLICGKCGNDDQRRIDTSTYEVHCRACGNMTTEGMTARWPFTRKEDEPVITKENQEIGVRIKTLRTAKGMSQQELAPAVIPDMHFDVISKIERGVNSVSTERMEKLAMVLGTTAEYIRTGNGDENRAADHATPESPIIKTIDQVGAKAGRHMTPYRESTIIRMIKAGRTNKDIMATTHTSSATLTKIRAMLKAKADMEREADMSEPQPIEIEPDVMDTITTEEPEPLIIGLPDSVIVGMIPTIAKHIVDHFPDVLSAEITKALSLKKVVFEIGGRP